jgi:hypothetical protein
MHVALNLPGCSKRGVHVGWCRLVGTGMGMVRLGDGCEFKELVCVLVGQQLGLSGVGLASPLGQLGRRPGKSGAPGRGPWGVAAVDLVVAPPASSL